MKFLIKYYSFFKELFFLKSNKFLNLLYFYRHPIFHNYMAFLYYTVGLHTVLYLCGVSAQQFVVQLGMMPAVAGRFWYDVLPEFLGDRPSRRFFCETLEDVFVYISDNIDSWSFFCNNDTAFYCFFTIFGTPLVY